MLQSHDDTNLLAPQAWAQGERKNLTLNLDQTLFAQDTYTESDNTPAQNRVWPQRLMPTNDINYSCHKKAVEPV